MALNEQDILPVQETKVYYTSTYEKPLLRTGVAVDGSCFFHSFFMAWKEFRDLSTEEKKMYILSHRKQFADRLDIRNWLAIQDGSVAFVQILEMMRIVIHLLPSMTLDQTQKKIFDTFHVDPDHLRILFELLGPTEVDQEMLPDWDVECCRLEKNPDTQKEILLHRMKSTWREIYREKITYKLESLESEPDIPRMDEKSRLSIIHKLSDLSYFMFDYVVQKAFDDFRHEVCNYDTWVDLQHYLYLSDHIHSTFGLSVLFLDASTGTPFEGQRYFLESSSARREKDGYVVLLYFPENHFEPIGEISESRQDGKRVITRIFDASHPLIVSIFDYLFPPSNDHA